MHHFPLHRLGQHQAFLTTGTLVHNQHGGDDNGCTTVGTLDAHAPSRLIDDEMIVASLTFEYDVWHISNALALYNYRSASTFRVDPVNKTLGCLRSLFIGIGNAAPVGYVHVVHFNDPLGKRLFSRRPRDAMRCESNRVPYYNLMISI